MPQLLRYQTADGESPFGDWLKQLRNKAADTQIRLRLRRLEFGNFGDWAAVGDGVIELRLHVSPGYRMYLGLQSTELVILLCGGDKGSQRSDIAAAKRMWEDWKERCIEKVSGIGITSRSRG